MRDVDRLGPGCRIHQPFPRGFGSGGDRRSGRGRRRAVGGLRRLPRERARRGQRLLAVTHQRAVEGVHELHELDVRPGRLQFVECRLEVIELGGDERLLLDPDVIVGVIGAQFLPEGAKHPEAEQHLFGVPLLVELLLAGLTVCGELLLAVPLDLRFCRPFPPLPFQQEEEQDGDRGEAHGEGDGLRQDVDGDVDDDRGGRGLGRGDGRFDRAGRGGLDVRRLGRAAELVVLQLAPAGLVAARGRAVVEHGVAAVLGGLVGHGRGGGGEDGGHGGHREGDGQESRHEYLEGRGWAKGPPDEGGARHCPRNRI